MPELRLTDISVRALKGSANYVSYWDSITPGFCVRVGLRRKTFCVVRGKDRQRVTIGHYPDMSVADARTEAKKLLASEPEAAPPTTTFKEARAAFLATYKNPKTKYQVTRSLERHFKALEAMQLTSVTDADIKRCLDKLSDRPSEQLHAFRYLRALFNWTSRKPRQWVKISPMHGYDPPGKDKRGSRILTDDELRAVWHAAEGPRFAVIRLLILWGLRNSEACSLARTWLHGDVLVIPGEHVKNGRDHALPLTEHTRTVLLGVQNNELYFFTGRDIDTHIHHGALGKLKRTVMKASGTSGWQLRDLRRTFRSLAARAGVPREIAELLINHAPPVLDQIYDRHLYLSEKREALEKIHTLVQSIVSRD